MKPLNPLRPSVPFLYPHGSLIFSGDIKREYCDLKVWVTSKACFNFSYTHFIIKWERWDVKGLTILKFRKNEIANWKKLTPSKMLFVKYFSVNRTTLFKKEEHLHSDYHGCRCCWKNIFWEDRKKSEKNKVLELIQT